MTAPEPGEIVRIAARGDGVTRDGRYATLVAPGDILQPDGSVVAGPNRADPRCPHFPACGGCQLQQLSDAAFADYLVDRIAGALAGQGIAVPSIAHPHVSPPASRRRTSLHAARKGGAVVLGFHRAGSREIVDMRVCPVLDTALFALVAPIRRLLSATSGWRSATVDLVHADQGPDVLIEGIGATSLAEIERLTDFARQNGLARFANDDGDGPQVQWEPEPVTVTLGGVPVHLPHRAFLQATPDGEAALVEAVRAGIADAATVADLFAGLGTFALALAEGRRVYAAEASRDAAAALKAAADRNRRAVFVEHRDLYRRPLAPAEISRFDAVVIDPPRAGAEEQCAAIAASTLKRLVYVSCNPATFARDAKMLIDTGFTIENLRPVGQFNWSTHVELCAVLAR